MQNKIIVSPDPKYPASIVSFKSKKYKAVIGRYGAVPKIKKFEGDGHTPLGSFEVLGVYYRPDRLDKPDTNLPVIQIEPDDIWVDDPASEMYNQPTKLGSVPEGTSYEKLHRQDHLYDVFLDLDYNRRSPKPGMGSAIFMHVARDEDNPSSKPTKGCIALKKADLISLIELIDENTIVEVQ